MPKLLVTYGIQGGDLLMNGEYNHSPLVGRLIKFMFQMINVSNLGFLDYVRVILENILIEYSLNM